jgi:methylated-DNA-[protein]-cysteine S-methyltransferase
VTHRRNSFSLTDFQLRVLEETLKIPFGEVRTYRWIAKRIGHPKAVRAVGSALRRNPYPLLIPCHRVVRANADIGRYSRGREVKKKLIEFEKRLKNIFATAKTQRASKKAKL